MPGKPTSHPLIRIFLPLAGAFLVIVMEPLLTDLAKARPGVVPVAMATLLGGLLIQSVRHWLIVALCFGISLLALRDTFKVIPEAPASLALDQYSLFYRIAWALLAATAGVAAVIEALHPGNVWARRLYFGAASIYFTGHGLPGFLRQPNWESLMLLGTGIVAAAGVVFADRIVAAETLTDPEDEDVLAHHERMEKRSAHLVEREWRDPGEETQARA